MYQYMYKYNHISMNVYTIMYQYIFIYVYVYIYKNVPILTPLYGWTEQYSIVRFYPICFFSPVNGHLGISTCFLPTVNSAALNINVQIFVWTSLWPT